MSELEMRDDEFRAMVARRSAEIKRAYKPLPTPAQVERDRRRARRRAIALFPMTVRRFERVFSAQGESLISRWVLAVRFAWTTIPQIPPTTKTPSAGAGREGTPVPQAGSFTPRSDR